jgi:hypothetical protein
MNSTVDAPRVSDSSIDDGATRHLVGAQLASVPLKATNREMVDLSALADRIVVYADPEQADQGSTIPPGGT